jgi:hypothetical protein
MGVINLAPVFKKMKSKRKRRFKWRPKVGTPICHHTREAYLDYK